MIPFGEILSRQVWDPCALKFPAFWTKPAGVVTLWSTESLIFVPSFNYPSTVLTAQSFATRAEQ